MTFEQPLWEMWPERNHERFSVPPELPDEELLDLDLSAETCTLVFQVSIDEIRQNDLRILAGQIGCAALSVLRRVADDTHP